MSEQIEVYPQDGAWSWRHMRDGEAVDVGDYETRSEAIASARAYAGQETVNLTRADGTVVGSASLGGSCRIVLMRPDGSEYGELDPAPSAGGSPQRVSLEPAVVNDAVQEG